MVSIPRAILAVTFAFAQAPCSDAAGRSENGFFADVSVPQPVVLKSAWTQYGPASVLEARAVVEGKSCPDLVLDLKHVAMQLRALGDDKFPTICAASLPAGTKQAALAIRLYTNTPPPRSADTAAWLAWREKETGVIAPKPKAPVAEWLGWRDRIDAAARYQVVPLPVPPKDPQRILVIGDTGCRIKGTSLQDCSKEELWPFARIAAEGAKLRPDLVIHVGDYLYRESQCPANFSGCQGTPFGDNWPTWDADFFAPAAALLTAAPWVIVRGNHEDCHRAGLGFLRLLGPSDPKAACVEHLPSYAIPFAGLNLVVMDNADAPETSVVENAVPAYRAEIAALAKEPAPTWWLLHRPIWGAISGPLNLPIGGNLTMMAGLEGQTIPANISLMLSGHIHTFQAINYAPQDHVPPQVVAGFGGDMLDPTPTNLRGAIFQGSSGVSVQDGLSIGGFGFLLMTKEDDSWRIDVHDWRGRIERVCHLAKGRVDCPAPVAKRKR